MPGAWLSTDQKDAFVRDGFIKVPGLVPPEVVSSTRAAVASELGIDDADPATWAGKPTTAGDAWKVTLPCWTPAIEAAGRELVGPHIASGPKISPYLEGIGADPWIEGYIPVLRYPDGGEPVFGPVPTSYHVDGARFVTLWPEELYLVVFVYLVDVKDYGGATVVLPGSHRQIFEHWVGHPEAAETKAPELAYRDPLPVEGRAGDVIFMHYLCAHSSSANHDRHIRYGLNGSINVDRTHPYERRVGPPAVDWTPMDYTLRTDTLNG